MYSKSELLNLIFANFRQQTDKPTAGYWWTAQHFVRFINFSLKKPIEYGEFISLMLELCADDIFEIAEKSNNEIQTFELTEKGANMLWNV